MATHTNFLLTPQQQELLYTALNSTSRPPAVSSDLTLSPTALDQVSALSKPVDLGTGLEDGSFLDYDYPFDGGDNSLDYSLDENGQSNYADNFPDGTSNDDVKTESVPSNADNDSPDKRSHPDDEDDDDGSGAKRRESTEKVPKKPGRKPLTSEPSSKRKAQNRAAQRAFRERKEKHLKDLETKVAELEKASETAQSENGLLRAQIDKMTVELNEYKKRMALLAKSRSTYPHGGHQVFGNPIFNNINDVNFQFEFPKFGHVAPLPAAASVSSRSSAPSLKAPSSDAATSPAKDSTGVTTANTSEQNSPSASSNNSAKKTAQKEDLSKLSSVFTPPLTSNNVVNASRTSLDSASTSSPSTSCHTNTAPSSSCGTSPEPYNQSPMGFKPVDTLTTIGEEQQQQQLPTMFAPTNPNHNQADLSQFANVDINDMGWLNAQTNFRFDPQLFGDYREPQENILSSGGFDDTFFNDALEVDFTTPFNTAPSPVLQKTNLIAQIDAAKDQEFASSNINAVPAVSNTNKLTCNNIWEKLQNCPRVQNGDFDLDGLCSDLQKKAKCSGTGAVVDESDFKLVMKKYLGKEGEDCADAALVPNAQNQVKS
ncbi:ap-1-like, bzip transcription factor [Niveomyces insectorum RCEF 264]|uniref:Ap-1-like, bzip transcription factor n=1 Tax=Niveomyces insectorum RCEF 264 TaxID=1081102 RepID=A0A167TXU8_9HYPO|nr:ap-1-like, bzip transcription factor [Niveomyces insectorum RCEF 264]